MAQVPAFHGKNVAHLLLPEVASRQASPAMNGADHQGQVVARWRAWPDSFVADRQATAAER
jgi:hypothetical protein